MKSEKIYGAAMMVLQSEAIEKELLIENMVSNTSEFGENIIGDLVGHIKDLVFLEKAVFRTRQLIAAKKKANLRDKKKLQTSEIKEEVHTPGEAIEAGDPLSESEVTKVLSDAKQRLNRGSGGDKPANRKR